MGTIKVLDKLLSDMIAAGEVVERPASVVKELFENAKDAAAGRITIEIQNGGKSMICITDDGIGMDRDDAVLSVVRHATSKIRTKEDLFSIETMGFRGEALASICAVSKLTIITRKAEAVSGTKLVCDGGNVISVEDIGCPAGTRITVENLFYHTPARLKFLKKDASEGAYIEETVARLILANPHIAVQFIKENRPVFSSKGDGDIRSAIYAVYGSQLSEELIAVDRNIDGVLVSGYVGSPNLARPTRKFEHFSINGRICRSKVLFSALEFAYFQKMAQGKYPFCVLDISVDYHLCDVNVHPQKSEVKFSDEASIYQAVLTSVRDALEERLFIKEPTTVPIRTSDAVAYAPDEKDYLQHSFVPIPKSNERKEEPIFNKLNDFTFFRERDSSSTTETDEDLPTSEMPVTDRDDRMAELPEDTGFSTEDSSAGASEGTEIFRVIGQVFSTYILIEKGEELLLLDQHAAHERINYERIHREYTQKEFHSQMLIAPKILEMSPSDYRLALDHLEQFAKVGIIAEDFQDNFIIIREIPCEIKERHIEKLVYEILGEIRHSGKALPDNFNQRLLFLVACKMSVKANTDLSLYEMKDLVRQAFALNGKTTCPHGRPLFIAFPKTYIETKFER